MRKAWLVLVVLVGIALLAPSLWRAAQSQSYHLPSGDGHADWLWGIAWAPVLALLLLAWPVPWPERRSLLLLWAAKVAVALGLMLYYEQHYGALDAFGYFSHAVDPAFDPASGMLGDGTRNMYVLTWAFARVVPDSYHAMKLTYAYVGLVAVYLVYRAAALAFDRRDRRLLLFLGLFPSVLFWSSILGKDPVVLLGIALWTLGAAMLYRRRALGLLPLALGFLVFLFFRPWLFLILLVPTVVVAAGILILRLPLVARRVVVGVVAVLALAAIVAALTAAEGPGGASLLRALDAQSRAWAEGGSGETPPAFTSVWVALAFLPWGMFTALFRPLPGEIWSSAFGVLAGLENLVLLVLTWFAIRRSSWRDVREPAVVWGLLFVGLWACVYAFLSYQNLGTGFRFRLQVLPAMLVLLWALALRVPGRRPTRRRA